MALNFKGDAYTWAGALAAGPEFLVFYNRCSLLERGVHRFQSAARSPHLEIVETAHQDEEQYRHRDTTGCIEASHQRQGEGRVAWRCESGMIWSSSVPIFFLLL